LCLFSDTPTGAASAGTSAIRHSPQAAISQGFGPLAGQLSTLESSHVELRQVVARKILSGVTLTMEDFSQIGNQSAISGVLKASAGNIEGLIKHQTIIKHLAEIFSENRKLKPIFDPIFQMTIPGIKFSIYATHIILISCIRFNCLGGLAYHSIRRHTWSRTLPIKTSRPARL
jgi:hypothetical protein